MLRRLFLTLAAAAAFATSASICVVALAFALYALVEPYVGRAGGAAIVAGAAVGGVAERVLRFVREKPVVAISAALGAGFLAVRNPRYLGAAVRAFFEGREIPRR